jgi:hypothetical protein
MIKMVAGAPEKPVLMLGLSFNNLDEFKSKPNDTYIRIKGEEFVLPIDVILASGASMRALGTEQPSGKTVFIINLGSDELDMLKENPGTSLIRLSKEAYRIPMDVLIFSGESEQKMLLDYAEMIGPETKTTIDRRTING